jgi:hypothetical protein
MTDKTKPKIKKPRTKKPKGKANTKQKQMQRQSVVVNINSNRIAKQSGARKALQQKLQQNQRIVPVPYLASNSRAEVHQMYNAGEINQLSQRIPVPKPIVETAKIDTPIPIKIEKKTPQVYNRSDNSEFLAKSQNANPFMTPQKDEMQTLMDYNDPMLTQRLNTKQKEFDNLPVEYDDIYEEPKEIVKESNPQAKGGVRREYPHADLKLMQLVQLKILARTKGINIRKESVNKFGKLIKRDMNKAEIIDLIKTANNFSL